MEENKYPKIFIIILNYNGKETLRKCLDSVFYSDYPNIETVVVDNSSTDNSLELARSAFPKFHFIKNAANSGFAAGNNVGIRFALEKMADYVMLLNNDATLEKETASKMIAASEKEKAGIFSPLILDKDGEIWFSKGKIKWREMRAIHERNKPNTKNPYFSEYVSGCAMLVKKEVFKKIGLLSEDYFLYYEDADFCQRAAKKGIRCMVIPDAAAIHFEKSELDLSNKIYWLVISGLIFFGKNSSAPMKLWLRSYLYLRKVKNIIDNLSEKTKYSYVVTKAYKDYKKWKKNPHYPL